MPAGFRKLGKNEMESGDAAMMVRDADTGELQTQAKVGRKKCIPEGYVRADALDKKKLRKYVKALATEAELYRKARKG